MFSKFSHANQPYQVINNLTDPNNNNCNITNNNNISNNTIVSQSQTNPSNNMIKNNFTHPVHNPNNSNQNMNGMNSNEFRNMDEEEDDVDSLNINFDDVNDQSDIDDYYNNCSVQSINSANLNNELNSCANLIAKNENCLYEISQHINHINSKIPNNLNDNQTKQQIVNNLTSNAKLSQCSYITSSSILESVITNEINSNESAFNITNQTKPNNRNIHCVKEKIRRDRIKLSCNQLRKLVPNVNGFKTDMASLLETSVLWAQLINSNVPEQYLNNIKAKLGSLATIKNTSQIKNMQQIQTAVTNNQNIINQKYKTNYEYLLAKNQQESNAQHRQLEMLQNTQNTSPSSILSSLNSNQLDTSGIDVNLTNLPASLNLKPNSWLPYSFQLNNEVNNSQKILNNIAQTNGNHHQLSNYNEFYDKIIKKSPSNTNFNYER